MPSHRLYVSLGLRGHGAWQRRPGCLVVDGKACRVNWLWVADLEIKGLWEYGGLPASLDPTAQLRGHALGDEIYVGYRWHTKGKLRVDIGVSYREISLGDYIHPDQHVRPREVNLRYPALIQDETTRKGYPHHIDFSIHRAVGEVHLRYADWDQTSCINNGLGNSACRGSPVPKG